MTRAFLRPAVAAAAMVFLLTATPGAAPAAAPSPIEFDACSQCHPDEGSAWCVGLLITAVGACCGNQNQNAWAWCVNSEWGFYVNCQGQGIECQCNEWGSNCSMLPPRFND